MGRTRKDQNFTGEPDSSDLMAPLSVALNLDDLLPDKTGAVVIQVDGERLEIQLDDGDEILARGIAPEDTQSEHFDVSGMDFVSFANGVTLYFPAGEVHLTFKSAPKKKAAPPPMSMFQLIERELHNEKPLLLKRRPVKDGH
ncbi:MAG: hypothetical protein HYU58_05420 [Proteobacteria bacterium]|nr:hypothetical protein [Pseudomonadota bacterium]